MAARAVSSIDTISQASFSTPMLIAVAKPSTGTAMPTPPYTRQIRCSSRTADTARSLPGSVSALRALGGNMLAATVMGPTAMIAARTWRESRNLVTVGR